MKTSLTADYSFTASTRTLDFSATSGFDVKRLVAVINLTRGVIIYAPSVTGYSSISGGNVLTLSYDTTSQSDSDALMVLYDAPHLGRQADAASQSAALSTEDVALLGALLTDATFSAATGAAITGQSLEAGGSGLLGWLASLRKAFTDRLPASLGQKAKAASLAVTLASDDDLLARIGEVQASPTTNTLLDRLKAIMTALAGTLTVSGSVEVANDVGNPLPVSASALPLPSGAATSANQATQITVEQAIQAGLGATNDSAATSDGGTFSLIALIKRLLGKVPAALGQTTKANSLAVVLPSDYQAPILPTNIAPAVTSVTSNNADMVAAMDVSNYRSGSLQLTGFGSATVQVQVSTDAGTTWNAVPCRSIALSVGVNTALTATGLYLFELPATAQLRIRTTAYASGTIAGVLTLSSLPPTTPFNAQLSTTQVSFTDGQGVSEPSLTAQNSGAVWLQVMAYLYNGSTIDMARGVNALPLLSSGARTANQNSTDQINRNWHGLLLTVDVSNAGTGSITPSIQVKDPVSGNYKTIWTAAAALTANGTYVYALAPNAAAASFTEAVQLLLSRTWRLAMIHNNVNSITYSASADMVL